MLATWSPLIKTNARNTLLRALLDVLIASEEYTHVFLYFDDVRFGPEEAGEDLPTLWTETLIACSQLTRGKCTSLVHWANL